MKILIATKNKGKIEGTKRAFEKYFDNVEVEGVPVESDVNEQPINEETYQGAINRVKNLKAYAKQNNIQADFYVSIESGMINLYGSWTITNIAVIEDALGKSSIGASPSFPVSDDKVDEIKQRTLGVVMDELFNEQDLRQYGGGIQLLTHGVISRIDITEDAFVMALTKFINKGKWD